MIGIAGFPSSGMLAFDQVIIDLMNTYAVPGTAIAVSRDGTVVIERGYGLLDLNDPNSQATAVNPFRVASVSKPITAMTILKLIEQNGPLTLESLVWELLKDDFPLLPGQTLAIGVDQIRIRHLLQHSAGWDDSVYDPMFDVDKIAKEVGMPPPADQRAIIRKMWSKPLVNNPPGSKYAYSNFHYCLLGRVIEHVTGQRYADCVASVMLGPLKMDSTFQGSSFLSGRHAGEARYFPYPDEPQANSVFPPFSLVDAPYGSFDLENMDSHGGWVSSPRDLLSFINGIFRGTFLSSSSLSAITSDSISMGSPGTFYGLGWNLKAADSGFTFWHVGRLDGSTTIVVRTTWSDGSEVSWAALMNMRDGGQTAGPAAAGAPSISIFGDQQHVAYLDGNGAVQDAWYDGGTNAWKLQQINLIGVTAGLPAAGDPCVSVFGQQQHFAYRDSSGTIQDAWYDSASNTWSLQQINMGAETTGPAAVGNVFISVFGEQQHFAYRDAAGAIQDAWYDSGSNNWSLQQINLGGVTAGSSAAGDPSVSVFGDQQHFVYRDTAGTIHDAWYDAGSNTWSLQQINVGGVTNAPAAAGEPCASAFGQQQHFVYRDSFGVVWDSWYDADSNRWNLQQINCSGVTDGPLAAADPDVLVIDQEQHFAYRDENGIIWDAWYDGASDAWNLQQINSTGGVTKGPAASGGPVLWALDGQQHFTYVDANGTICDSWYDAASENWDLQQINKHGLSLSDALDTAMWSALKALPSLP
jgi:CubicO group peptidase (beta-lactamase class C family)/catechol 2,3-dioxygenase-like lactoylglutathione lyase family enzyme